MTNELFEQLLYEEESTTLDFKQEQYRFVKAGDDEKSELLKDVLGFANAWRRSDAYILIGVEDVRGGRSIVHGIQAADQLNDHSLQQFVNNLCNQPVRFHYEAFTFEGKQVGIIRIEPQTRPLYLKYDYGKLSKEKVYVRRGSSTDPTKPASLEEVAQMRVAAAPAVAEVVVEFAELERDASLGATVALEAELCGLPPFETIPDLQDSDRRGPFRNALSPFGEPNSDYYRELAMFEFCRRLYRPVRLLVRNAGSVVAKNVRVELRAVTHSVINIAERSELPQAPSRRRDILANSIDRVARARVVRDPGEVDIIRNNETIIVSSECGDLQPGRKITTEKFLIGCKETGSVVMTGQVFAENLPQPTQFELSIAATITISVLTPDDVTELRNPLYDKP